MIVVGLMSGTSADGTDAAVVEIDGRPPRLAWRVLSHIGLPHPPALREAIFAAFQPGRSDAASLCALNVALGHAFADAAVVAIREAGLSPHAVNLIGSHGQTVWHIPQGDEASTLQLGEAAVIAEQTGITTVSNFRTRDMAAGGQGAPLVAYVDALLLQDPEKVRAAQNIGGIANVTYLPPHGDAGGTAGAARATDDSWLAGVFAFDTGPGNMLIDYAAGRASGGTISFDQDGALAARGAVHHELLQALLRDPYLRLSPPKTTGRERFGSQYGAAIWERAKGQGLRDEDTVATLTAFTAESIVRAYREFLPRYPQEIILSGGGARNRTLVSMLESLARPARLRLSEEVGLPVDAKEAIAFALLAYETWHGRPGNLPAATGARRRVVLGDITLGERMFCDGVKDNGR